MLKQLESASKENQTLKVRMELMDREISEKESELHSLRDETENLRQERAEMESCLRRKLRATVDFEDEVFAVEENLQKEIKQQSLELEDHKTTIYNLKKENLVLTVKIQDLLASAEEYKKAVRELENELGNLSSVKNDMLQTIRTLTQDNEIYMSDYKESQQQLFLLKNSVVNIKDTSPSVSHVSTQCNLVKNTVKDQEGQRDTYTEKSSEQRKILIIGDSTIMDLYKALQKQANLEAYKIISIVEHNALLESITENICDLTKDFTKRDYVILSGGQRNALCGGSVDLTVFQSLTQMCEYRNLILFSVPLWGNRQILNKFIDQVNIKMYEFSQNQLRNKTHYLGLNSFLNSSFFVFRANTLRFVGKVRIAEKISQLLSQHFLV